MIFGFFAEKISGGREAGFRRFWGLFKGGLGKNGRKKMVFAW